MKQARRTIADILDLHVPRVSDSDVEAAGERVLYRLHHVIPHPSTEGTAADFAPLQPAPANRWWVVIAVAAVVVLALVLPRALSKKDSVNEPVRSNAANTTLQTLSDGSRIESRAGSEWEVHTANDGRIIRLVRGSVIITAAKQRHGHFYVQTRDVTTSVVGTVFIVSAEERQSQVGVVEGQVRVRRGDSEVLLRHGEQISSISFMKEALAQNTFDWSRSASEYIALLARTTQGPEKASFEVASIRRNTSESAGGGMGPRGDRLRGTNVTLKSLMLYAYRDGDERMLRNQIIGAPTWADTDRFDIDAKMSVDSRTLSQEQIREMVRSLLEDRFQLKAHRATRELPVYNLVQLKGGLKLSSDQTPPPVNQMWINFATEGEALTPLQRGAARIVESPTRSVLTGTAVSMSTILELLQGQSDRIILDKTNFKGLMDFDVQIAKDSGAAPPPETPVPSLFTAVQELGVKLESSKATLPVVIIDSVQPPSPN